MNNVKYKEQLTRIVLDHSIGNAWSYEEAIKKWWFNPRGGLRLTQVGDLEFRFAKIEYYDHDFQVSKKYSWYAFILDLDKKIKFTTYQPFVKVLPVSVAIQYLSGTFLF